MTKKPILNLSVSPELQRQHPSLQGAIPPFLRFGDKYHKQNIKQDIRGAKKELMLFINKFGHSGQYHNLEHFNKVNEYISTAIRTVMESHPGIFSEQDLIAGEIFAYGHDCVHNGAREIPYTLNLLSIGELYGFNYSNVWIHDHLRGAINFGILEDNNITNGNRKLIVSNTEPIELSEEEMSSIVTDSILYRNGIGFDLRCKISGMIQATEFRRSMEDGHPGFKWPRTALEVIAKLSDMGSFCEDINTWLRVCSNIYLENPSYKVNDALSFVELESDFINNFLKPIFNPNFIPKVIGYEDDSIPPYIADYFYQKIVEKEEFLSRIKTLIENADQNLSQLSNSGIDTDDELTRLSQAILPVLQKNNLSLEGEKNPIPLASPRIIEL